MVGVGLGGVGDVPQQMRGAKLVPCEGSGQFGVVVQAVAVVDGDPGERGQHAEVLEGGQVPPAEPVQGVQVGGGRQDVLLGPDRPDPKGGLVEPDHVRRRDQSLDQSDHVLDGIRGPGEHPVHEPGRGLGTGQVGDQLGAPLDRDMLVDQQVDHQCPQVRAVADGRVSDISGTSRDVRASATAPATVQVVLDHLRRHLRHLMHLM